MRAALRVTIWRGGQWPRSSECSSPPGSRKLFAASIAALAATAGGFIAYPN